MSYTNSINTSFKNQLIAIQGKVFETNTISDSGYGIGEDRDFHYLWEPDKIYVAVRKSFCKWGNSCDFVLYRSIDRIDLSVLRRACFHAIAHNNYDKGWGHEYDIRGEYRRARRNKI